MQPEMTPAPPSSYPQSWWSWIRSWLAPRAQDRDEAFRERSIRIAIVLVIGIGLLSFVMTLFVFRNEWGVVSFPTLHLVVLAGFFIAAYAITRGQIRAAAMAVVVTSLLAAAGYVLLADRETMGADASSGIPLFMFVVLVAALVMPRNAILPIGAIAVALYLAATVSAYDTGAAFSSIATLSVVVILAEAAILYRLRIEFDARLEAMRASIQRAELAQQQAEEARIQAEADRQRAEEADKAKTQFLANMSHELRTPLNAIIGYDEAMLGGMVGEFTHQQLKLLGHIQHNSRRLLGLINDILDLSKIESDSVEVYLSPMSPHRVIWDTVDSVRSLADEKAIYLNVEIAEAVPEVVLGDANKLQQILVNLLSNAIKFTDKGGVTVAVTTLDSSRWQIAVRDTGIGMPEGAVSYIFEPFQQVDGTDRRRYKGTGLGLAITRRLIERLGGTITVESRLGEGSTFSVVFPRAYVPGEAAEPQAEAEKT